MANANANLACHSLSDIDCHCPLTWAWLLYFVVFRLQLLLGNKTVNRNESMISLLTGQCEWVTVTDLSWDLRISQQNLQWTRLRRSPIIINYNAYANYLNSAQSQHYHSYIKSMLLYLTRANGSSCCDHCIIRRTIVMCTSNITFWQLPKCITHKPPAHLALVIMWLLPTRNNLPPPPPPYITNFAPSYQTNGTHLVH